MQHDLRARFRGLKGGLATCQAGPNNVDVVQTPILGFTAGPKFLRR